MSKAGKQHSHQISGPKPTAAPLAVPVPPPHLSFPPPPTPSAPHALPRREAAASRATCARTVRGARRCRAGDVPACRAGGCSPASPAQGGGQRDLTRSGLPHAVPCGPVHAFPRGRPTAHRPPGTPLRRSSLPLPPLPGHCCREAASPPPTHGRRRSDPPAAILRVRRHTTSPPSIRWDRPAVQGEGRRLAAPGTNQRAPFFSRQRNARPQAGWGV